MDLNVHSDESDDDLLQPVDLALIGATLLLSQAYLELVRGIVAPPLLRPILYDPFKSSSIVEQLVSGHPDACKDAIGMSAEGLRRITAEIEQARTVKPSPTVELRAKIAMTLWMLRKSASNRTTREFWQFSQASVSK
jgi:hypothetical protein